MPPSAAPLFARLACTALALLALCVPAASARSADAYWDTSDELVATVGTAWDDAAGVYRVPGDPPGTRLNSSMLLVHALAAQAGHAGLSRQDVRAVRIVRRMVTAPAFDARLNPAQAHAPGWGASLDDATFQQHVAIDARVEEALAAAYVAGDTLGLTGTDRAQIRDRLCRVAGSPLYSRPQLNQVNWMADVYAACVAVGGDTRLLRSSYRRWLVWFLEHARTPAPGRKTSNLNAGFGLHYVPQRKTSSALNQLPTTEYNSIIVTALRPYDDAVARGMKPLDRRLIGVARRWQGRVLYGEWTAAGYPNWDTGLGFARWHMRRYWAWSTDGLLSIAQGGAIGVSAPARVRTRRRRSTPRSTCTPASIARRPARPSRRCRSASCTRRPRSTPTGCSCPRGSPSLAARAAIDGFRRRRRQAAPAELRLRPRHPPSHDRDAALQHRDRAALARRQRRRRTGAAVRRVRVPGLRHRRQRRVAHRVRRPHRRGGRAILETQPGAGSARAASLASFRGSSGGGTFTGSRTATSRVVGRGGLKATITHRFGATSVTVYHRLRGLGGRRLTAQVRFPAYGAADFALVHGAATIPLGAQRTAVSGPRHAPHHAARRARLRRRAADRAPRRHDRARCRRHAHALGAADALDAARRDAAEGRRRRHRLPAGAGRA